MWSLWPNIRFLPSIVAEKNATKNEHICSMCIKINKVGKQEVGISWVQQRFPRYGVPIWSLWPNIRFLPSIVAEKNVMKNVYICSMCIKSRQTGSRNLTGPKTLPTIWYTYRIWHLWPNIRFLPSTVTEKNILDERKDTGKTVYPPLPSGSGGINTSYKQFTKRNNSFSLLSIVL
jgi:ribosomal protein L28